MFILFLRRSQYEKQERILLATLMLCGGMTGMSLNLLFLLNFQATFGSIYEMIGAMIASNMLGMALGAWATLWILKRFRSKVFLTAILSVLIIIVVFVPELLNLLLRVRLVPLTIIITLLNGVLIGLLFGTVNRIYLYNSQNVGNIYAFDVAGSSIGALTTCSVLLPILGIQNLSLFFILLFIPLLLATKFLYRHS